MFDVDQTIGLPRVSTLPPDEVLDQVTAASQQSAAGLVPVSPVWQTPASNAIFSKPTSGTEAATTPTPVLPDAPQQVTGVTATESPYRAKDGSLLSLVAVDFTPVTGDRNFDHVIIWFQNYNGSSNWQAITQGSQSPLSFLCDTTGEIVTIKVQAISSDGVAAPFDAAPTTTVLLDGVASAPPSPSIAQQTIATPVGFQFSFNYETGLIADTIQGYWIYASNTNNVNSALRLKYVLHSAQNAGVYTFQETVNPGTTRYYWVSAVNTSSLESPLQPAQYDTPVLDHAIADRFHPSHSVAYSQRQRVFDSAECL